MNKVTPIWQEKYIHDSSVQYSAQVQSFHVLLLSFVNYKVDVSKTRHIKKICDVRVADLKNKAHNYGPWLQENEIL